MPWRWLPLKAELLPLEKFQLSKECSKAMKYDCCQIIPREKKIIIHLGIWKNQDKLPMAGDASIKAGSGQRQTTYICFISQHMYMCNSSSPVLHLYSDTTMQSSTWGVTGCPSMGWCRCWARWRAGGKSCFCGSDLSHGHSIPLAWLEPPAQAVTVLLGDQEPAQALVDQQSVCVQLSPKPCPAWALLPLRIS